MQLLRAATFNRNTSPFKYVWGCVGGRFVGVGRVGGCLLSLRVCVCLCMGVCVRARRGGGGVQCNVCACGDFDACIGSVGVAFSATVLQNCYEIYTEFARTSYQIRVNFVRSSSPKCLQRRYCKCGCYEFRTKFEPFAPIFIIFVHNNNTHIPSIMSLCPYACVGDKCMHWWFFGCWSLGVWGC